jgi:hypothetical protein
MKIAQIAPLMESVPPRLYGGTERIVSYLTDELVRLGHEVTFGDGSSNGFPPFSWPMIMLRSTGGLIRLLQAT